MEHVTEKRKSVRTPCFIPAKVSEVTGRERLVRVTDLSLEGCKIVCASGSTNINLKSDITITFFEEKLVSKTDEETGKSYDKIQMVGVTPVAGTIQRWFSRNPDSSVRVYGIKFSHSIDYSHYIRKIIADSSH